MTIQKQSGVALVVALVFLLMLTILALTSSQVTIQQERMAGNYMEANTAFQTAESTMREIEQRLQVVVDRGPGASGGLPSNPPLWGDDEVLVDFPGDCTLETRFGEDWDMPDWQTAPDTGGQYFVIALSEFDSEGKPTGSACRPMGEMTRPDGTPLNPQFYLVTTRGYGPGDVSRRARAMSQSIYYREPSL